MSSAVGIRCSALLAKLIRIHAASNPLRTYSVLRAPVQRRAPVASRFLAARAAPALAEEPNAATNAPAAKTARSTPAAAGRSHTDRGRASGDARTADFEKSLAKLDMDVKRTGRVSLADFTACYEILKKAESISSQTALLMIRCCGSLLSDLKPVDRIKLTTELWDRLVASQTRLDISHYNALLKVHLENNYHFDPTAFLALLEQNKIAPNRVTYQRLAAFYCQQGDMDGTTKILEFMRAQDIPINETVFNVLIQGYARANDMTSAVGVLDMMRNSQLEPSTTTYRTLLEAYAEKGDMENVRKVLADVEKRGIELSDADFLDVVCALASKGHTQHAGELFARLRRHPGFFHDALDCSLRLLDYDASDLAYQVIGMLQLNKNVADRSGFGISFLKKLIRYGHPVEEIWHYASDMRQTGANPWAVERACEISLQLGRFDYLKEFFRKMAQNGIPVRSHYFWPLFSACRRDGNTKEVWEIMGLMHEVGVNLTLDTLTDYALPALGNMPSDEIIAETRSRFPAMSIVNPLLVYHLDSGNIKEATRLLDGHDIHINPSVMMKPLAEAYVKGGDYGAVEGLLRHIAQQRSVDAYDYVGQFLMNVVQLTKGDEAAMANVLKKLAGSGFTVSSAVLNSIDDQFGGRVPEQVGALLDRLVNRQTNLRLDTEGDYGKHPRHMGIEELEDHLKELKSKNMNTRGVLRRLLVEHARERDVKRAEEIRAELEAGNFVYSGAMHAQLIDMYTATGDVDKAMAIHQALEQMDSQFVIDSYKIFNLAALLVGKDRAPEAIQLLEQYIQKRGKPLELDSLERNIFRLLNAAAEKGNLEVVRNLWDLLPKMGNMVPTNQLCGPLVKVHLVKNDLSGAINAFEECTTRHKVTPWKNELMRKLIEAEDPKTLQQVMDATIKVHGETNALYDLAFSFIEAGRVKQAQKIFDTPGLRARHDRLEAFAERCMDNNRLPELEGLIGATRDIFDIDRDALYYHLIRLYGKNDQPDKALAMWTSMQEENVLASGKTLRALAEILRQHNREIPFDVPEDVTDRESAMPPEEQNLLQCIREDNLDEAMECKRRMGGKGQALSVKGYSYLIEGLLQKERIREAVKMTYELLENNQHPYPAVSRFLVSKLSRSGDVAQLEELLQAFPERIASYLQLNKHMFSAYVHANRVDEILDRYEKMEPTEYRLPITGLMALLQKYPNYLPRIEALTERCAQAGMLHPAIAVWNYLFTERRFDDAKKLMDRYPDLSVRLRTLPICERAQETNDPELLRQLIVTLRDHSRSNVALAYSYLIGLNCHNRDYKAALAVLQEAQEQAGMVLQEIRLPALRMLERGLIQMGQPVPFRIPEHPRTTQQERQMQQDIMPDEADSDDIKERKSFQN
ncbi:leucine-rich PPR motif-containing protein, mitochondrial-like [Paramacrobiotus metropolitanus]|uniref:leucine-rich PPR motif-containing protein, mitochondrial-like n=1 Tax=Paramacrobiotus metropolitanus TaxID=2943436 RepID=UPI002445FBD5|nr:leucine-rich PPR motif-containing protein, mitochondrial-like [Paramacrobiotus metropolitanus]